MIASRLTANSTCFTRTPGRAPRSSCGRLEPQAQCIPSHHQTVAFLARAVAGAGEPFLDVLASIERCFDLDREPGVDGYPICDPATHGDVADDAFDFELVAADAQGGELLFPAAQLVQALALFGQGGFIQILHGRTPSYSRTLPACRQSCHAGCALVDACAAWGDSPAPVPSADSRRARIRLLAHPQLR